MPFPNHVHRLESLKRHADLKGSESLTRSDLAFYGSVILFKGVVQVAYDPASAASAEFAGLPEFSYDFGV